MNSKIDRRSFLQAAGSFGLLALLPACQSSTAPSLIDIGKSEGFFLNPHELDTLRAVVDLLIPGPPADPDPGALEAGVAEAIDLLLGAFSLPVPPVHAGGPFSNRAGATHDDFADFVPMDALVELGWRIRIEGSLGLPEREFAGPIIGLQQIYRDGLALLDVRAQKKGKETFLALAATQRTLILADLSDGDVQNFVGAAMANTLEAMYGPPEYGGNRGLAGWGYTNWPGDVQPQGSTDDEVSKAGPHTLLLDLVTALGLLNQLLPSLAGRGAPRTALWKHIKGVG